MFWRVPGFLQSSNQHCPLDRDPCHVLCQLALRAPFPATRKRTVPSIKLVLPRTRSPPITKVPMSSRQRTPTTRHDKMAERRVGRRAERRAEGRWSARGGQAGSAQAPAAGMCWRQARAPAGCYTGYDKPHMPPRQKCACVRGAPATVRGAADGGGGCAVSGQRPPCIVWAA